MPDPVLLWDLFIDHEALSLLALASLPFGLAATGRALANRRPWARRSAPTGATRTRLLPGVDA